jgi:diaminopimelate decarboxylase
VLEPGRLIAGNSGILVAKVIYVKKAGERTFVILDGAMNDLARPSLYGAYHHILPVREAAADAPQELIDFVGPICETGDTFATSRASAPLEQGDLVAIMSAGAYGAVMASSYNTRPLTPEVLVSEDKFAVIRSRPDYEEMLSHEHIPNWVK